MILFTFFASLRTRSHFLIKHWAQVEALGYFFRGFNQPGRKSFTGAFIQGLVASWKDQERLYNGKMPSFNQKLQDTPVVTDAIDNFQKVIPKKNITGGKGAVTHIGTSLVVKRNRPVQLSLRSRFESEYGVTFKVSEITRLDTFRYRTLRRMAAVQKGTRDLPSAVRRINER
jgi:hypothetical protein